MQFLTVIFVAIAFTCSLGDKLDDANNYLDEVLTNHLPSAIEAAGITVYNLPDFTISHQEKTPEGHVLNTKTSYAAGNLTGLENAVREKCEDPSESSGSVSIVCLVALPQLQAEYAGRFQSIKGYQNPFGVHIRQFDFNLDINIRNVKIEIEVISSPSTQIPSLKRLSIKSAGERSVKVHTEASDPEDVTKGVEERFNVPLFQLFLGGEFKKALGTAVGNVRFPKTE